MFESVTSVDEQYYARHGAKRRARRRNNITYSSPGEVLTQTGIRQSPGTPYGVAQHTVDQNNALALRASRMHSERYGRVIDAGGPFASERWSVSAPLRVDRDWSATESVHGYCHAHQDASKWADQIHNGTMVSGRTSTLIGDAALMGYGSTGISRTLPTAPEMSLSVSAGELISGVPTMIGHQFRGDPSAHSAAGEFLNVEFGLLPLIKDAQDVIRLTKKYEEILTQFRRDQGRLVRRGISLVKDEKKSFGTLGTTYGQMGGGKNPLIAMGYTTKCTYETVDRTDVWFSGAYKLAYPLALDGALKDITEFNRVFGVIPTAELAWNVLPFSFIADWFTNVGDVVKNASTLGKNLQLAYGYVMAQESRDYSFSGSYGPTYLYSRPGAQFVDLKSTFSYVRKRRLKATPFGFSVAYSDLSSSQKGILTALGISRLRL